MRTAAGAYEGAAGVGAERSRGFGPLDPDEAWDARAEHDGYGYEEQELGLHPTHSDGMYNMNLAATPGMAPAGFGEEDERPRGRSPGLRPSTNPFDDDAEPSNISLRGVSPRPIDTAPVPAKGTGAKDVGDPESPTGRRSVFREEM